MKLARGDKMKMRIWMASIGAVALMLSGCGGSILGGSDWTKTDSVNPFNEEISRSYSASITRGNGQLILACPRKKEINLYYSYPVQKDIFEPLEAQIRIDDEDKVRRENWVILGSVGNSWPENPKFIKELFGKKRLAIEILVGSAAFDIRGISEAYDGLLETGCSEKLN